MTAPADDLPSDRSPRLQQLAPGIFAYLQPDGGWMVNNTGAVVGDHAVVLVDTTSTERRNRALLAAVAGVSGDKPVRTVVNTHHHADHTLGNWLLAGAEIVGHRLCREEVLRAGLIATALFTGPDYGHLEVAPPTLTFEDRLTLHVGAVRVELEFVGPAHTLGDLVVWLPDAEVVFAGDLVFNGGHPFLLEGCLGNYPAALDRVRRLGPRVVVPGHGPLAGPELLDRMTAYAQWLSATAADSHARGLAPLEAARRADLGPFAGLREAERLVGNLARAYSELEGQPRGTALPLAPVAVAMAQFAGGPLRCLA
jgi:glyoxylase-like metal-dependent hydrolase (beta-lactamase superfamily II)